MQWVTPLHKLVYKRTLEQASAAPTLRYSFMKVKHACTVKVVIFTTNRSNTVII